MSRTIEEPDVAQPPVDDADEMAHPHELNRAPRPFNYVEPGGGRVLDSGKLKRPFSSKEYEGLKPDLTGVLKFSLAAGSDSNGNGFERKRNGRDEKVQYIRRRGRR